jgi:cytochrome c oxidase subunit 2
MYAPVVVVEPEEFQLWLEGQEVGTPTAPEDMTPVERGAQLAEQQGCLSCHSIDGTTLVGPTWQGLFGSQRPLEDGSTVVADKDYLRKGILDPNSQVVEGFPNIMPAAYGFLTDEELAALVAYIESLSD